MDIKQVSSTAEIPGRDFVGVQSTDDREAEALLEQIASRLGVRVEIVYRWGQGYYYLPVPAKEE